MRTTITNNGSDKFFGFIPPHGKTIAQGGSVTVDGDLRTVLASGRHRTKTALAALTSAEEDGTVTVERAAEPSSSSSL